MSSITHQALFLRPLLRLIQKGNAAWILGSSIFVLSQFYRENLLLGILLTFNPLPYAGAYIAWQAGEWTDEYEDIKNGLKRRLGLLWIAAWSLIAPWLIYLFCNFLLAKLAGLLLRLGSMFS